MIEEMARPRVVAGITLHHARPGGSRRPLAAGQTNAAVILA
jgi:hypothetical protein